LGSGVLFHDAWVPYDQRASWLLEANCAVSAHLDHLEARYAHRTRLLDCFWAGLPIACTSGDELADRIERDDLGATAPTGDVDGLAAAIERVLTKGRDHYREGLARAAADHGWPRVAAPLLRWLKEPAPPRPRRRRAATAGELLRNGTYIAAASTAAKLHLPLPKAS
jgi:hypothetical protein